MLIVTQETRHDGRGCGYGHWAEEGDGYGNGYMNDSRDPGGSGEPPTNPGWDYADKDTCRFDLMDVIVHMVSRRLRC